MNGRTNSHGSTIDDLQVPLDPCTNLRAEAGNGSVTLYWDDPLDKYATPEGETAQNPQQLVSVWDHTIVVRKVGSQPANPNDGIVVTSSGVRDQYLSTGYTDTSLTNDTTYYYGVFAVNEDGVASDGAFISATPCAGVDVNTLPVGTIIKINENGAPVEYLIVNQGLPSSMYDASCDGCWVLRKDIAEKMEFGPGNDYKNSNIHSYLNGNWLTRYSAGVLSQIKQVKIPYMNGTGSDGSVASGANGLSCKSFLLGGYDLGWTSFEAGGTLPNDGVKLSYFDYGEIGSANKKRIANYNGSADCWWLRDPTISNHNGIYCVEQDGSWKSWNWSSNYGVRPALVLDNTTLISQDLTVVD